MKRGRNQRRRQGMNVNRALDSNGPDVRIRGTANQIYDKYLALARDANSSGDRVKAENYLQHAEHYFRVIRAMQPQAPSQLPNGDQQDAEGDQPGMSDNDRRFHRDPQRFDQPQAGFGGEDGEFDADQPESRFEPHPFAEDRSGDRQNDRQNDEGRRPDFQGRQDHRSDRGHQRHDNRNDFRNGHRNDQRRDQQRNEPRDRPPEPRGDDAPEGDREPRPDPARAEGNVEGRFDNDRRGRRRRRPRPPMSGDANAEGGADQPAAGEPGDVTPETV